MLWPLVLLAVIIVGNFVSDEIQARRAQRTIDRREREARDESRQQFPRE